MEKVALVPSGVGTRQLPGSPGQIDADLASNAGMKPMEAAWVRFLFVEEGAYLDVRVVVACPSKSAETAMRDAREKLLGMIERGLTIA
jgi:hypothetical protein